MAADVNWLLSSIAQGSAAMIAVVGGLLVSRYVGLHAEQEAARRRVSDVDARHTGATQRAKAAQTDLRDIEISSLINSGDVYDALLADGLTREHLFVITGGGRSGFDDDEVTRHLRELKAELLNAYAHLDRTVPGAAKHPIWIEFRSAHLDLPVTNNEAWRWSYDQTVRKRRTAALASTDVWQS
ncbi:hypothetical protein GCM10027421_00040 [Microbacterium shaanxiense]